MTDREWPCPNRRPTPHARGGLDLRRAWPGALSRWFFGKDRQAQGPAGPPVPVARFRNVCISRETGSGAGTIGRMVGTRLDWKVFDHELLEAIASRMELAIDEVRAFDELAPSVVQDWILPLREEHYAPQEAYLDHLAKLVEAIGRAGDSIIIGRGAGFLLPREETLSVRIVAPLKARADPPGRADGRLRPDRPPGRARPRPPPGPLRPDHVPGRRQRPAQLRPRPRLRQPGPADRRRDPGAGPIEAGGLPKVASNGRLVPALLHGRPWLES